jgi:hypothetical protein
MGQIIQFPLHLGPWRTFCQDCDPGCARPFEVPARRDPRTGDLLTPCPACGRVALADVPRAAAARRGRG